ncbi:MULTISPECIES: hypothetical protein [Microbacterium]|uniref:Uncharacterized protein n=1 Tax=Microbacterium wangchenii TaxID=2541726 RepID=A0ABX5SW36_9MICO|nr:MULTISPECIES: hypothetical protein [Microbacterium]MCK6066110.1 hypothetical protein [Microbacterium sp. EYE_512]QBR90391.1 hypothetical protein E4K62_17910 [Microbacterium wangchenii]TFV84802.1 hypothetical protein E4V99_07100 [Microbacterium sp. dk485]TXK11593.1 hypothetical protein FVP99_14315 [Microbacterium wangchenii]
MLLLVTGASAAGKSTTLAALADAARGLPLECAEFDSVGVPPDADTAWRHAAVEQWVQRAVSLQTSGVHLVLFGQVPMGELLAAPSADRLDAIEVCLLHCSAAVRAERLRRRGYAEADIVHHIRFGEWFLRHTLDPADGAEVIRLDNATGMRWGRWADWSKGDPRWAAEVIGTDALQPREVATRVEAWVREAVTRARPSPLR